MRWGCAEIGINHSCTPPPYIMENPYIPTQRNPNMNEKVPAKTKFFYGVGDWGISMLTASIQFFLLFFLTDVAHISPAIAGSALMAGKLTWDAINDPLLGSLSDRTKTR